MLGYYKCTGRLAADGWLAGGWCACVCACACGAMRKTGNHGILRRGVTLFSLKRLLSVCDVVLKEEDTLALRKPQAESTTGSTALAGAVGEYRHLRKYFQHLYSHFKQSDSYMCPNFVFKKNLFCLANGDAPSFVFR